MDAAKKFYTNTGTLLTTALALVLAAPGWAQTPALSLSTPVGLNQSVTSGSVTVMSSIAGTPITYTASISGLSANGGNGVWLALTSPATQTTTDTVSYHIAQTAGMVAGTYSATVTLTPSAPAGVAPASFVVQWTNGSGGGGGGGNGTISVSQNSVSLSASPGFSTSTSITVSTSSTTAVSLAAPTVTPTTCGNGWLGATLGPSTINNSINASLLITASAAGSVAPGS